MKRKIIKIDEDLCVGCGLCADACKEGAIEIIDGKAKLVRDDYCDGLGNCLPACPTGAISFEKREAAAFDESRGQQEKTKNEEPQKLACGCPGTQSRTIERKAAFEKAQSAQPAVSQLNQWPVQIKLVAPNAPYFKNANLLIAADCTAYAYGDFHNSFIKNKITLIGCPKLDETDYSEKLTEILEMNDIESITVVRMEVPCCGGIVNAVKQAISKSGKIVPWSIVTISTDGQIL